MAFKISEEKKGVVTVVSILLIVISLVSIYFTQCSGPGTPKVDISFYPVVGEVLAEETAKVLGNKGKIVVVTADTGKKSGVLGNILKNQLEAFQETIKKQGNINIVATETISESMYFKLMGPGMPPGPGGPQGQTETPGQWLMGLIQKYPNTSVDAVVSLVGFPMLSDEEIAGLGQTTPKFIISTMTPIFGPIKKLMEEQVIFCAVTPRMMRPANSTMPNTTPREKFNRQYEIVTPQTLASPEETSQ